MIHNYRIISEGEYTQILTALMHIRKHSHDRSVITDDCTTIETIMTGLETL